jgi:Ca2+-binding EF-hand superfamily protein
MNTTKKMKRNILAALAAFGFVSAGLAVNANAHPTGSDQRHGKHAGRPVVHQGGAWVRIGDGYKWRYRYQRDGRYYYDDRYQYDLNRDGRLDHNELDYRHYDLDGDGQLEADERRAYWKHMIEMGYFSELTAAEAQRVTHLAYLFDRNNDGRMTGAERRDLDRMIGALRRFDAADMNNDNFLSRGEARRSNALSSRFHQMDRNADGYVSRQEVRDDMIQSIKRGDRFWYGDDDRRYGHHDRRPDGHYYDDAYYDSDDHHGDARYEFRAGVRVDTNTRP